VSLFPLFSAAYTLAVKSRLLETSWFRQVFVRSYFAYKRFYEDPFLRLVKQNPDLFRNGDILDIGANVGYTSCLFASALSAGSKIYSFEPDRWNFDLLLEVIRKRKLNSTVMPVHAAVGANDGFVELWHNERHHADSRVITPAFKSGIRDEQVSSVPLITVDGFVESNGLKKISFIKIDVQGYEQAVCQGMRQTLVRFPDAVVAIEYGPQAIADLGFEPKGVLDFFSSIGYFSYSLAPSHIERVENRAAIDKALGKKGYIDLLYSKQRLSHI
jgi:FkbM family methyltransferase